MLKFYVAYLLGGAVFYGLVVYQIADALVRALAPYLGGR